MLASLLGIRLILWMGRTVPVPPSAEVVAALTEVQVRSDAATGDGFQLTFTLGRDDPLDYRLLQSGAVDPFTRVVIGVLLGAVPEVLIDGIVTHREVSPGGEGRAPSLTVTGRDVSVMMDLEEKNQEYRNQPDWLIVSRVIAGYAQYGLLPKPTPTADVPIELFRVPRQHETDLRFVQRLADANGFVFYVEPLTFGVNLAYWGPENRLSVPQPALTADMGPATNVRQLRFSEDALAPVAAEGTFTEPITKTTLPIPPLPTLKVPPLALSPTPARRTVLLRETSKANPAQAATAAVAAATSAPDSVTGSAEIDTVRYGGVLRARKLVGVRGAGYSNDGFYYVRSVTHTIRRGDYRQSCTLSREGTGALLPVVRP
ncbi:MAG TPA: hypothetical protein VHL78_02470 [Actinomycetota bacterium]|nr:hypothetical protein [Actinomycetota bacterium]